MKFDATRKAKEWLDGRVGELRQEVSDAEGRLEARRAQLGALAAGGTTLMKQGIRDLNTQLSVAQGEYSAEKAKLDNLNTQLRLGKGVDAIPEALASTAIQALRTQQAEIARKKAELQAKYYDNYPDVKAAVAQEEDIKRQIDAMERVKLNALHLHLSDSQAFRVESRRFPKLTAGLGRDYYSHEQIRDLVAYAAERGVRIVPEFDVPGHTEAIIAAFPDARRIGRVREAAETLTWR